MGAGGQRGAMQRPRGKRLIGVAIEQRFYFIAAAAATAASDWTSLPMTSRSYGAAIVAGIVTASQKCNKKIVGEGAGVATVGG
jgi:hypothetical protein